MPNFGIHVNPYIGHVHDQPDSKSVSCHIVKKRKKVHSHAVPSQSANLTACAYIWL